MEERLGGCPAPNTGDGWSTDTAGGIPDSTLSPGGRRPQIKPTTRRCVPGTHPIAGEGAGFGDRQRNGSGCPARTPNSIGSAYITDNEEWC